MYRINKNIERTEQTKEQQRKKPTNYQWRMIDTKKYAQLFHTPC